MADFADALARHVSPEAGSFVQLVFALHDPAELRGLLETAGFRSIDVRRTTKPLRVPPPGRFMWEYIHSTPMAGIVEKLDEQHRTALERDVTSRWQAYGADGGMRLDVDMTTAIGLK